MQFVDRALALVTKAVTAIRRLESPLRGGRGWLTVIREPFTGAWQQNAELVPDSPLANPTAFACVTLIATDIGKLELRLVEDADGDDVWRPTKNPAYSPVLRRPNRYQITAKFIEQWILSKLIAGNTYVLKQRDARGVVSALYILDPLKVTPLLAPDGAVYYEVTLDTNDPAATTLADLLEAGRVVIPSSEIIHDLMYPLAGQPLIGISPIYAAAAPALQGLKIQDNSTQFFGNNSRPSGVLLAPGKIDKDQADRMKASWKEGFSGPNYGNVAVLTDGLKYEQLSVSAVDSQLIEQLKWTTVEICKCYHVPVSLIDTSQQPPYGKQEYLFRQYYSQCLQTLLKNFEDSLDDGLELAANLGTELDIDGLIWMDTETRTKAAADSIGAGALSPNEARYKFFGLGKVDGGDSPYLQQQYYSLEALAARDAGDPFAPVPAPTLPAPDPTLAAFVTALRTKLETISYAS